jgi:maltooligosyltrehalose trehalohydrolase
VILDVVYNHLGPDGNYLGRFSEEYFEKRDAHTTPWGDALNLDKKTGRPVREFLVGNARYWANEYHVDGLRIDAVQAMHDLAEPKIWHELARSIKKQDPGRSFFIIAEDDTNESRLVTPLEDGGDGLDLVWADDFHQQVHVALTGERGGYYVDYNGTIEELATTLREGWFYTGQHSKWFEHEGRPARRGKPARHLAPPRFLYCLQNHDQVGNRALGDRLNHQVEPAAYRAVSALLLLGPYTPLLFMGQEWAASSPFLFFTDHTESIGQGVTEGRRKQLEKMFPGFSRNPWPKPQELATFHSSKLRWEERTQPPCANALRLYRELLRLRRELPALQRRDRAAFEVTPIRERALALRREGARPEDTALLIVNLSGKLVYPLHEHETTRPPGNAPWQLQLDTEDAAYGGRSDTRFEGARIEMTGSGALLLVPASLPSSKAERRPTTAEPCPVVISYSRKDVDEAKRLAEDLEARGIRVWRDEDMIVGGAQWRKAIVAAINSCVVVVFLVSKHSMKSRYVPKELAIADEAEKVILPVCLDATRIGGEFKFLLAGKQLLKFFDVDRQEALKQLLRALREHGVTPGSAGP